MGIDFDPNFSAQFYKLPPSLKAAVSIADSLGISSKAEIGKAQALSFKKIDESNRKILRQVATTGKLPK